MKKLITKIARVILYDEIQDLKDKVDELTQLAYKNTKSKILPKHIQNMDLAQIKEHLMQGDQIKIAKATGFNWNYIEQIVNGRSKNPNKTVLDSARMLIHLNSEYMKNSPKK